MRLQHPPTIDVTALPERHDRGFVTIQIDDIVRIMRAGIDWYEQMLGFVNEDPSIGTHFEACKSQAESIVYVLENLNAVESAYRFDNFKMSMIEALNVRFFVKHTCPKCLGGIPNDLERGKYAGAISRRSDIEICSDCGTTEALEDYEASKNPKTFEQLLEEDAEIQRMLGK